MMVVAFSRGYQLVEEPCDRVDFFDKRGYRNILDLHSQLNHLFEKNRIKIYIKVDSFNIIFETLRCIDITLFYK